MTQDLEQHWRELMIAALDGEANAYRRLLADVRVRLQRYFARRLSSALADSADDLVQETLLALHSRRLTYDRNQPVCPWIFAIARYKLIDLLRRHKVRASVPLDEDAAIFAIDDEPATSARMDVETVLATMPERQGTLIRTVRIDGATIAEAASAAGMSETAAKVSIHRGLKTLGARFAERGDK